MPLDWSAVRVRYQRETPLPPIAGTRTLTVVSVDEDGLTVRSSIWTKGVKREHLERAVELMEAGVISRRWEDFVEQYGRHVTSERRSLSATILKDLGEIG